MYHSADQTINEKLAEQPVTSWESTASDPFGIGINTVQGNILVSGTIDRMLKLLNKLAVEEYPEEFV